MAPRHLECVRPPRALRQVRQKPVLWAACRKVGLLDVWSSSFSPWGKAGICLLCTELGRGCYSECLHVGPNRLLSLSRLQVSRVCWILSTQWQARQKPVLRVDLYNWNTRHMVQFITCLLKEKLVTGACLPIVWRCAIDRDSSRRMCPILLQPSMWLVLHTPGV